MRWRILQLLPGLSGASIVSIKNFRSITCKNLISRGRYMPSRMDTDVVDRALGMNPEIQQFEHHQHQKERRK
jgi:hypothetical protein